MKTSDNTESLPLGTRLEKRIIALARNLLAVYGLYLPLVLLLDVEFSWAGLLEIFAAPSFIFIVYLDTSNWTDADHNTLNAIITAGILSACLFFRSKIASWILFSCSLVLWLLLLLALEAISQA